jgi:hypothetical protein
MIHQRKYEIFILFWDSASCCAYFIKVIRRTVLRNNFQGVYFILFCILPLHVSALVGHLQAEYTIILGSYFNIYIYILIS